MKISCNLGSKLCRMDISVIGFSLFVFLKRSLNKKTTLETPVADFGRYKGPVLSPSVAW